MSAWAKIIPYNSLKFKVSSVTGKIRHWLTVHSVIIRAPVSTWVAISYTFLRVTFGHSSGISHVKEILQNKNINNNNVLLGEKIEDISFISISGFR